MIRLATTMFLAFTALAQVSFADDSCRGTGLPTDPEVNPACRYTPSTQSNQMLTLENTMKKLHAAHPDNQALADIVLQLASFTKTAQKYDVLVKAFRLDDVSSVETTIDETLNTESTDPLTAGEIAILAKLLS